MREISPEVPVVCGGKIYGRRQEWKSEGVVDGKSGDDKTSELKKWWIRRRLTLSSATTLSVLSALMLLVGW